ncbi:hypothetical protein EYR38_003029 [Pleurotus pulmonarius]|nr:hypothetical protein EYR38_003029 [Pleurotus pulmonarius]
MVDKNPSTVSHLLGKRSDPQLTLGLAVGFGATALVLTAFISFLLGHYFGRRAALKSLGKDEGESLTQMALALSYDRRTKTTSGYSYKGVTTTDIESVRTDPSTTMQTNMPAVGSSELRMPHNASQLTSNTTDTDFSGTIYGSWYGGNAGRGMGGSPGQQNQATASTNIAISTSSPYSLHPEAPVSRRPFTHGTPLTQISESTSSSAWSQPSPPQTHQQVSYVDSGAATGALPAVNTDTLQTPPLNTQHAHAATLPTRSSAAPVSKLSPASTPVSSPVADINRSLTTSKPPSYPHHEFPGVTQYSSFSSVIQNEVRLPTSGQELLPSLDTASNSASSVSKKPDRRSSVLFGPRSARS